MKSEHSLKLATSAAIKRVQKDAEAIYILSEGLKSQFKPDEMNAMREATNDLVQRVHEYNAYRNALETG